MRASMAKGPSTSLSGGSGTVTSTFTAGNIPLATTAANLGNSLLSQAAGVVTLAGAFTVTGITTLSNLAGAGTRMVVADLNGVLSTQTIPVGGSLASPTALVGLVAVAGALTSGMRSDGAPALSQAIVPTWSGIHTFTVQPVFSSLTASLPVFTDGLKGLVSNAMTGTGNVVMSASPTLSGTVTAAALSLSTTLLVTGVVTLSNLAGAGTRMVVADLNGVLSTQAIPAGGTLANPTAVIGLVAVNGAAASSMRSDGAPALSQAIVPTWSGIHTFTVQPVFSSLTASLPVFTDGLKGLVSNAMTGTGNVVMSAAPTLTGTTGAASLTLSGTLVGTGAATFNGGLGVGIAGGVGNPFNVLNANVSVGYTAVIATSGIVAGSSNGLIISAGTNTADNAVLIRNQATAILFAIRGDGLVIIAGGLTVGTTLTVTGITTFTAQPVLSSLTASLPVFTDASKGLVSNAMTGTGNVVMSASPTLTGTIAGAAMTLSSTLTVTGASQLTGIVGIGGAGVTYSALTISSAALALAAQYGIVVFPTFTSAATASAAPLYTQLKTAATAFTMVSGYGAWIESPALGAGSVITNLYGLKINDQTAGTNSWAIYTGLGAVHFGGAVDIATTLAVTGITTFTAQPIFSSLTASLPVFTDASKGLVSNTMTGTGNVVMSASPTLTGTITGAALTLSGALIVGTTLTVNTQNFVVASTGNVAIGLAGPNTSTTLDVRIASGTLGISQYGITVQMTFTTAATSNGIGQLLFVGTPAAVMTMTNLIGLLIDISVKGAGSTITNLYGLKINDQTVGTNSWAIYTGLGAVHFGGAVDMATTLTVTGLSTLGTWVGGTAPSSATNCFFGNNALNQTTNLNNAAIYQDNVGSTRINSATGRTTAFTIAGVGYVTLNTTLLDVQVPTNISGIVAMASDASVGGKLTYLYTGITYVALTIATALIAVDASLSDYFKVTLNVNATLSNPTNAVTGRRFTVRVRQDAVGTRTLAYGTAFRFPGNVVPVVSASTAQVTYLAFQWNEDDSKWDNIGLSQSFG